MVTRNLIKEVKKKINDYLLICEYIILDTYSKKASGGTGKSFDWNEYSSLFSKKVFVAGGLNPDNVSEVVKTYAPGVPIICFFTEAGFVRGPRKLKIVLIPFGCIYN